MKKMYVTFLSFILGGLIGYFAGFYGVLVLYIPAIIGTIFGTWYGKKMKKSNIFIDIVARSNVVTWIIPIVGLLTGTIVISIGNKLNIKKYKILGMIGVGVAIINVLVTIALKVDWANFSRTDGNYALFSILVASGIINVIREYVVSKKDPK